MARGKSNTYWFKPSWIVAVILSVIPVVNWVLGVVHRLVRGNLLGVVLYVLFGAVLGFVDFITILVFRSIIFFA